MRPARCVRRRARCDRALTAQAGAIEEQLDADGEQISSVGDDVAKTRGVWSGLADTGWRVICPAPARTGDPSSAWCGEHESIQLVAAPYAMRLPGATARAEVHGSPGGLRAGAHPVFSLDTRPPVEAHPATATAFRPSVYTGWTPDPIDQQPHLRTAIGHDPKA